MRKIEHQSFLLLLGAVSLAFAWVLHPFYGAVLWATVIAVIFEPLHRRLLIPMRGRRGLAAALTVLIIIAIVILPLIMIATLLVQEASGLVAKIQSGEYDFGSYLHRIVDALPAWATGLIEPRPATPRAVVACVGSLAWWPPTGSPPMARCRS